METKLNAKDHFLDWKKLKSLVICIIDKALGIADKNANWYNFMWRGISQSLVKLCTILPFDSAIPF